MSVFSVMVGKDIFKCFHIPSFSLTFEVISKKEIKAKNSTIKSWIKIQTEKEVNWYPLKDTFCFYLHIFLCNFLSDNSIITIKLSIFPIFICVWPWGVYVCGHNSDLPCLGVCACYKRPEMVYAPWRGKQMKILQRNYYILLYQSIHSYTRLISLMEE